MFLRKDIRRCSRSLRHVATTSAGAVRSARGSLHDPGADVASGSCVLPAADDADAGAVPAVSWVYPRELRVLGSRPKAAHDAPDGSTNAASCSARGGPVGCRLHSGVVHLATICEHYPHLHSQVSKQSYDLARTTIFSRSRCSSTTTDPIFDILLRCCVALMVCQTAFEPQARRARREFSQ